VPEATPEPIILHSFRYWARKFQSKHQAASTGTIRWLSVKMDESPVREEG